MKWLLHTLLFSTLIATITWVLLVAFFCTAGATREFTWVFSRLFFRWIWLATFVWSIFFTLRDKKGG